MRTLLHLSLLILLLPKISSQAEPKGDPGKMDVETYIKLLKTGQYNYSSLPAFTFNDIPADIITINK